MGGLTLAALAVFAAGRACDIRSSRGLPEANPLFRDPFGRFDARRNAAVSAGYGAAMLALSAAYPLPAQLALGFGAVVSCGVAFHNRAVRRRLGEWTARLRAEMIAEGDRKREAARAAGREGA